MSLTTFLSGVTLGESGEEQVNLITPGGGLTVTTTGLSVPGRLTTGTASTTEGGLVAGNATNALTLTIAAPNTATSSKTATFPNVTGNIAVQAPPQALSAATGAIAIPAEPHKIVVITYAAGAGAFTLAAPTTVTDDGKIVVVVSATAQAHVITGGVDGFNAKGSSGTATYGGAIGDAVIFVANGGHWYTASKVNVTIA